MWNTAARAELEVAVDIVNTSPVLYLLDQVHAHADGRRIPPGPTGNHDDDLLNTREAAALLGWTAQSVREADKAGRLDGGIDRYGHRFWPRRILNQRRDNPMPKAPKGPVRERLGTEYGERE
ncbi:hypothetical protein AB0I28_32895 [Phytomonospora sp. NPDC050363]|uniref:hypothetical protein n=1 Tax=Phytomonospora sp. NPDC050363 TaxID=3155642 RepID=UPI0033DE5FCF